MFGGTYSGQILLWDTRSKHLPILKTPLSAAGHTHPVYAMQIVGTQNAHNLITSSTDGMVCSWLVDMLAQPQVKFMFSRFKLKTRVDMLVSRKLWNSNTPGITRPRKLRLPHWTSPTTKPRHSGLEQKKVTFIRPIAKTELVRKRD